ncbi:MAG: hypothetical protein GXP53_11010 [Deltaproteobacteria bacterium]|nr:hypothetical protein [Deltaproteobacteria bacterium]
MKDLWRKTKGAMMSLMGRMDEYQEAITFAEADQHQLVAREAEAEKEKNEIGKLLVVGSESTFSHDVIEYAIDMARRLTYEIIALNAAPLSKKMMKLVPAACDDACREFKAQSEENAVAFSEAALAAGIAFTHTVRFAETDDAIREVNKEFGGVDFVISEPEEERISGRPVAENRLRNDIHVYSMM